MKLISGWRGLGALGLAAGALAIGASPVAAGVVNTSGSPGNYTVTDTNSNPGAHCFYPKASLQSNDLSKIKIPAPKLYGRSGTQWVGWQYSIQHGTTAGSDPAAWTTYYKSPVMKLQATVSTPAAFTTQTWIAGNHINRWWRVKLLMFWYKPGSKTTISGQVNWLIDWYQISYPPNTVLPMSPDCIPGE